MKNITFLLFVILASCTSTRIESSWKEPDKEVSISQLNKVLVVALFNNETNSHGAEDQMAAYLEGKGVVSYNYLGKGIDKKNEDAIRDKIKADGFDGAVTMRLVDVDREKMYVPANSYPFSPYNRTFSGFYYRNWPNYLDGGYYANTKTYTVETNVYSLKEDKIIWTGVTKTTNPAGVNKMTQEIAKVLYKKMLKEGFISKP